MRQSKDTGIKGSTRDKGGTVMRVIGVTGGVGSGKSFVLNYIEEHFDARVVLSLIHI